MPDPFVRPELDGHDCVLLACGMDEDGVLAPIHTQTPGLDTLDRCMRMARLGLLIASEENEATRTYHTTALGIWYLRDAGGSPRAVH